MKKISTIMFCIFISIMMLTGSENELTDNNVENQNIKFSKTIDKLSKKANKVIDNYKGTIKSEDYKDFKSLVLYEDSRRILIQNISDLERTIAHSDSMISLFEKYGDTEEVKWYQSKKEKAEETLLEIQKELEILTQQEKILLE